jgi:hypothetical protein
MGWTAKRMRRTTARTPSARSCSVEGCRKTVWGGQWCAMHASRMYMHGSLTLYRASRDEDERIENYIHHEPNTGCWLWGGFVDKDGYGSALVKNPNGHGRGLTRRAHRVVYERCRGPIPEGLTLDHLCKVRCCVNPAHLEPVTMRENVMRGDGITAQNAQKTHCKRGHEFSTANTYVEKSGGRTCRACRDLHKPSKNASARHSPCVICEKQFARVRVNHGYAHRYCLKENSL